MPPILRAALQGQRWVSFIGCMMFYTPDFDSDDSPDYIPTGLLSLACSARCWNMQGMLFTVPSYAPEAVYASLAELVERGILLHVPTTATSLGGYVAVAGDGVFEQLRELADEAPSDELDESDDAVEH